MGNVSYDYFRKDHPQYPDEYGDRFRSVYVCSVPGVHNSTFSIYADELRLIRELAKYGEPVFIDCGELELVDKVIKWYPQYKDKVRHDPWYEDSISFVAVSSAKAPGF
jgi:hypothetical protein